MSSGRGRPQRGFTYLVAMFAVAIAGLLLAVTSEVSSHSRQREKEKELLYIGDQFREAIALYYQRTPGTVKRYPEKLEELLEDKRYLSMQRYLRKIYTDPMTGQEFRVLHYGEQKSVPKGLFGAAIGTGGIGGAGGINAGAAGGGLAGAVLGNAMGGGAQPGGSMGAPTFGGSTCGN